MSDRISVEQYRRLPKTRMAFNGHAAIKAHLDSLHCTYVEEYEFAKPIGRKFRADFAVFDAHSRPVVLIEYQGQTYRKGGHSSGSGIDRDCTKANIAQCLGFKLLAFTANMLKREPGLFQETLLTALNGMTQKQWRDGKQR